MCLIENADTSKHKGGATMKTINSLFIIATGFVSLAFIAVAIVGYATEFLNNNVTFSLWGL
jgi:hypothetical protein